MRPVGRRRTKDLDLPPRMRRGGKSYYYDHGGKPRRWEPLGSDLAIALKRWAVLRGASSHDRSVATLVDAYIARYAKDLAENTLRNYQRYAATIKRVFGHIPAGSVTTGHVQEFIDRHDRPHEARNTIALLSAMMRRAIAWGWRESNPCDTLERPPPARRTRYLTDDEFLAIRAAVSPVYQIAMDLAYLLSLRVSDVVRLRLPAEGATIIEFVQKKTGSAQAFTITPELAEVIARARAVPRRVRGLTLLCTERGRPYAEDTVSGALREAARALKIDGVRFSDLRAKSASDEQETAQQRLGHADGKTTRRHYIRKVEPVAPLRRKLL